MFQNPVRTQSDVNNGLTYFDANSQRLVTIENDVLGIKEEIQRTWPQVRVYFDEWDEKWVLTEVCEDGNERLIFDTEQLDRRVLDRLHMADGATGVDFLHEIEKEEARLQKERRDKLLDQAGDVAERLALAMHQDGITNRPKIFVGDQYESLRDENRT